VYALDLATATAERLRILCIGAHSDDIEIGCGGLILSLLKRRAKVEVAWVVFSAPPGRDREANRGARLFLKGAARRRVTLLKFRDGHFPFDGAAIKKEFEGLKHNVTPDLILTHYRRDRHQDHRMLSDLTWNTFRDHWILEYEIPKFDGDLGTPNCFVPLNETICEEKTRYLLTAFGSQRKKHWFSDEIFKGLMRLRGMECRSPSGYAEAFYGRKIALNI